MNHESEKVINVDMKVMAMPIAIVIASFLLSLGLIIGLNGQGTWFGTRAGLAISTNNAAANTATTTSATTSTAAAGGTTGAVTKDQIVALAKSQGALTFGNADSNVNFVEFGDPSCTFCHFASGKNPELNKQRPQFTLVADGGTYVAPVVEFKKLVDEGKASYTFVYTNGAGNGRIAAQAMYCAHEQGKFWPVHDLLFSNAGYNLINGTVKNDKAQSGTMAEFLASAIDQNFMKGCLESGKYEARLTSDEQVALQFGVQGTPGYYVNTTNYAGAYSYKDMEAVVNAAL